MNKERALQGIEALIQDGNNVLKTMRNSELGGTYVDSAMYNSWLTKAIAFLKLFLEDDNEFTPVYNFSIKKCHTGLSDV